MMTRPSRGFSLVELQVSLAFCLLLMLILYPVVKLSFGYYAATEERVSLQRQLSLAKLAIDTDMLEAHPTTFQHFPNRIQFSFSGDKRVEESEQKRGGKVSWDQIRGYFVVSDGDRSYLKWQSYDESAAVISAASRSANVNSAKMTIKTIARDITHLEVPKIWADPQGNSQMVELRLAATSRGKRPRTLDIQWVVHLRESILVED